MFGLFSLVTDYSNSALSRWDPEYMGAFYWEYPDIYRQCSPSTYLESIKTPVLVLHGDSDDNTNRQATITAQLLMDETSSATQRLQCQRSRLGPGPELHKLNRR